VRLRDLVEPLARFKLTCTIDGDADREVIGIATLEDARPNELSFLSNAKYEKALTTTKAGAVIVAQAQTVPPGLTVLRVPDPYAAMCVLMVHIHGYRQHPRTGLDTRATIHPTARIGENANIHHGVTICENVVIGKNAAIYPGCYIAAACQIGDNVALFPNVVIYEGCILGHRVTIHANSTIGEDGLGYAPVGEKWHKIPQIGIVEIGDDVEIGANCSIDRATLGRTLIGPGTKFSNQIAIGHGTKIGRDCMFGNHVTMAGKVGVAGHLTIGDNAQLAAMSGVMNDIPDGAAMAGAPAVPIKDAMRSFSLIARLPEMHKRMKELEAEVEALRRALSGQ
jgi:UDP-3-O-[3-hydroxymyristoyl] glucosamine N-acyltransferase